MENLLTAEDRQTLIAIAREAITTHLSSGLLLPPEEPGPALRAKRGCFVCIKAKGVLRGCIGNFVSDKPLYLLVQEIAVAAAVKDPRFYPMKQGDPDDFSLEISVLGPLEKIEEVETIEVGRHGIYMEKNFSRGVLLPQVAVENGWDRETFLAQTSLKAGLEREAWREGTDIFTFTADVISE